MATIQKFPHLARKFYSKIAQKFYQDIYTSLTKCPSIKASSEANLLTCLGAADHRIAPVRVDFHTTKCERKIDSEFFANRTFYSVANSSFTEIPLMKQSWSGRPWNQSFPLSEVHSSDHTGKTWQQQIRGMSSRVPRSSLAGGQGSGAVRLYLQSPGMIADPYVPPSGRPKLTLATRWFTARGWKKTRQDILDYVKTAYAVAKLRRHARGFTQRKFYDDISSTYQQINACLARGDKTALRQHVTENVFSGLKRELRDRESRGWARVDWKRGSGPTTVKTSQGRLVAVDPKNTDNAFVQLTLTITSQQVFAAYDKKGKLLAGDPSKEVPVEDIWVFERPLLHPELPWRLCGRVA